MTQVHELPQVEPFDGVSASELISRFGQAVNRYFVRRVRDRSEAEDLTQEVFARLLRRDGPVPIENAEGYLFRVAANLLTERARQGARRRTLDEDAHREDWVEGGEEFSPERILLGKEAYTQVVEALLELPERTRMIFILNRYEDMSGTEIAKRLGLSVSAVEKQMMRALAHLRERLK
jgi:RNA polymerase sigma-70 factor (ECF subfamily)